MPAIEPAETPGSAAARGAVRRGGAASTPAGPEPLRPRRAEAGGDRVSYLSHLECFRCARQYPPGRLFQGCPACAADRPSNLFCVYDYGRLAGAFGPGTLDGRPATMWRYRELLPVGDGPVVSLDEGMTPLIHCPRLGARYGLRRLYVKDESRNPTWSFKDRHGGRRRHQGAGARMRRPDHRVHRQRRRGHRRLCGARRAPRGDPDHAQRARGHASLHAGVRRHGGRGAHASPTAGPWSARGSSSTAGSRCRTSSRPPVGANPYALDGAKTVGFELCEQLGWRAPDVVVAPVSYGDLPVATWRGFVEFRGLGLIDRMPRMMAAEVFGPVANALARGLDHTEPMPGGRSVATSAAATNSTYQSLRMVRDTGGLAVTASDDEIMAAQLELAETEGLWAEPAAALPLAVTRKLAARGDVGPDEVVVAVVTSSRPQGPRGHRRPARPTSP